jgi:LuxR family quorum sensing-dependent transcriptional regulator
MAQIPFVSLYEFGDCCMKARRPEAISEPLTRLAAQHGFTSWYAGSLVHESEIHLGFGFYCSPPEWSRRYTERRYCDVDPVFLRARAEESPIRWSDCRRLNDPSKPALQVLDEASHFELNDGLTKAWHGFGEVPGIVTFGGRKPDLSSKAQMSLLLLGAFAYEGFRRVAQGFRPVSPLLTQRELDVLRWSAEGKTAWEIGRILSISERTVRCYGDQLKRKYKVSTMIQVIVHALLDGNLKVQPSTRHN